MAHSTFHFPRNSGLIRIRRRGSYEEDPFSIPQPHWYTRGWQAITDWTHSLMRYRVLRIPKLNWFIILFFTAFLIRLTMVYSSIYMKTALTTMIVSNLLLYGLADTLAQSLTMFVAFKPDTGSDAGFRIPYVLEKLEVRRIRLPEEPSQDESEDETGDQPHQDDDVEATINNGHDPVHNPYESDDTDSINSQELAELGLADDTHTFRLLDQSEDRNSTNDTTTSTPDSYSSPTHYNHHYISSPSGNNTNTRRHKITIKEQAENPDAMKKYDFRRLSLFMVWGFVQALLQYCWYAVLNSLYKEDNLFLSTLKRVLTDQLFYSPISLFAFFIYSTIVMGRGDRAALIVKLRSAYLQTLVVNYAVWPAAQFVNFLLMPVSLQVPFASTVGVFWNAYLSLKNASAPK
ncbi:uncharacterized protein SAPINGB_P000031 [Magnusiomyces paraingens]|uniref:Protein sym1 n=1 Tax=Magnusiomyces paraingens TaxID=2606893 RepID=A0A5E8AY63_9ASCO|nr:uncharacterized protein SAPINGB_P000031 [Saprochaete ingens]VVT43539.1 unnamed protein product [Saprochaete ingens]